MTIVSVSYENGLIEDLRNPAEAAEYINAAIEEGSEEMLVLALQDVAKAMQIDDPAYQGSFEKSSPASIFSAEDGARLCRLGVIFQRMGLKLGVEAGF